jgi:hypothetical protein
MQLPNVRCAWGDAVASSETKRFFSKPKAVQGHSMAAGGSQWRKQRITVAELLIVFSPYRILPKAA